MITIPSYVVSHCMITMPSYVVSHCTNYSYGKLLQASVQLNNENVHSVSFYSVAVVLYNVNINNY